MMMDKINGTGTREGHNIRLPKNTYSNLKKVALERNVPMTELLAELVETYTQNNKHLIERGIVVT